MFTLFRKRRVLIITRDISYPGGTEIFIQNFLSYTLTNRSVSKNKYYLLETDGHNSFRHNVYKQLETKGLNIIKINEKGDCFWSIDKAKQIQDIIKEKKINLVHSFLFNSDFSVLLAKKGSRFVFNELKKIGNHDLNKVFPNINNLNSDTIEPTSFRWVSSKFNSFSVALEKNTVIWRLRKIIIDELLEPIVSKEADMITCVSNLGKRKWSRFTNKKVLVVPCTSVSREEFQKFQKVKLKTGFNLKNKSRVFVVVSRLVEGKGLSLLTRAFKDYLKIYPDDCLFIVGDGEIRGCLQKIAGETSNINFLGLLPRSKVFKILRLSDFFCLFSESEGLPLSIQEAMALGKVVLATKVGGISDLVSEGVNGYLCKPRSKTSILNVLLRARGLSESQYSKMSKNSQAIISKNFLREKTYSRLLHIYREI